MKQGGDVQHLSTSGIQLQLFGHCPAKFPDPMRLIAQDWPKGIECCEAKPNGLVEVTAQGEIKRLELLILLGNSGDLRR